MTKMEEPGDSNTFGWDETNSLMPGSFLSTTNFEDNRGDSSDSESFLLDDSLVQLDHQHDPFLNGAALNQKSCFGLCDTKESNTRYLPVSRLILRGPSSSYVDTLQHQHCQIAALYH